MAAPRGRRGTVRAASAQERAPAAGATRSESAGIVPELLRRAVGLGFSGLFTTEELLRKALGDKVPREWAEFVAAQTDRARTELIDRLAAELRRSLDGLDLEELLRRVLASHTVEIDARIRFTPAAEGETPRVRVRVGSEDPK
jgi:nitrogen-specific signal transduction histidine kinase